MNQARESLHDTIRAYEREYGKKEVSKKIKQHLNQMMRRKEQNVYR